MPAGGRRPGPGAPRGNLNALKTGRHSAQLEAALRAAISRDEIRPILLAIIEKRRRENARFQALVFAIAKLINNANLTPEIVQRMAVFLESEDAQAESDNHFQKQLNSKGQFPPARSSASAETPVLE